jgi:hypothetical protein
VPGLFKQDESAGTFPVIQKSAVTFLKDESAGTYSIIEKSG